jgi:hypothetical protein
VQPGRPDTDNPSEAQNIQGLPSTSNTRLKQTTERTRNPEHAGTAPSAKDAPFTFTMGAQYAKQQHTEKIF